MTAIIVKTIAVGSVVIVTAVAVIAVITVIMPVTAVIAVKSVVVVVAHSCVWTTVIKCMAMVSPVAHPSVAVPTVSSAIRHVHGWAGEVEMCAVWIACIYSEVPTACIPIQRTVKVGGFAKRPILPVEKNISQVNVASLPICAIHIVASSHSHKIVEVYLIGCIIL